MNSMQHGQTNLMEWRNKPGNSSPIVDPVPVRVIQELNVGALEFPHSLFVLLFARHCSYLWEFYLQCNSSEYH